MRRALDDGGGPYLHAQRDRRLVELVSAAEKTPKKMTGPRLVKAVELSPFPLDPAGNIDVHTRNLSNPPPQFELIRF
jgi:hypothetical protein